MRLAVAALALILSAPAHAGGIGLIVAGGAHTERMWFHSDEIVSDDGDKVVVTDPDQFEKYEMSQTLPHGGGGIEIVLGDRDDKITGSFRLMYMQDAPQTDPAEVTDQVDPAHVIAAYRDETRHIGTGVVGLNFGIIGNPDNFQAGLTAHLGSGFLTTDHSEFLLGDVGPSAQYKLTRQMQLFGDVTYQMRYHKGLSNGVQGLVGVRYMFD